MKTRLKQGIKSLLCVKAFNAALIPAARLCSPILPQRVLQKIPYVGQTRLRLPDSKEVVLESDGNDPVATMVFWGGMQGFEASALRLFLELVKSSEVIFDVGANTGIYTLIAGIANPRSKVYAFEPVPRVCGYFERNVEINRLTNVELHRAALTNYDGEIELYVPPKTLPSSASTLKGFVANTEALRVEARTIDSFVAQHEIPRVDLLKIDTEATEHLVLEGGRKTIERDKPAIICEVLPGRTESQLHAVMDGLGFKYFWISGEGLVEKQKIVGDPTYKEANYLFITEEKLIASSIRENVG
ncbi:MAG TPA: FkbM family methyltransferase [Thermoguttaceae bacterium]|nr:FkbM family methyltransferase [Thermoguttaceae bacterium]